MMLPRSSSIDHINIKTVSFSSILQLGDSCIINGFSRALAVQREVEYIFANEGNYSDYSVFIEPISFAQINENISFRAHHLKPIIKVNNLHIIGASSSSVLHVGNSGHVSMETRVMHIRQLLPKGQEQSR
jgi:spore germination protein PE